MGMLRVEPGKVAVVSLDRPPANALTRDFFVELITVLGELDIPEVRAVVLTGSGRFFSAGLDLYEVFAYDPAGFRDFTARFDAGFAALFAFPKPVVAAVNGHAIAGGAVLAAAADFSLMAESGGRIGLTEILVGVPFPRGILEIVRFAAGARHLEEVLYHGRTYTPAEGCDRGLVDMVVPAVELMAQAMALAEELATREPTAFAAIKRELRGDALARIGTHAPGADPIWEVWRSPATHAAVDAYRARTLAKGRA